MIDLLVLTHIDSDHIGGLIEGFKDSYYLPALVKRVWFNSAASVAKYFSREIIKDHYINDDFSLSLNTSIKEGQTFEALIKAYQIWDEQVIDTGFIPELPSGFDIKILSPDTVSLERLIKKWKPYSSGEDLSTSGCSHDYASSYSQLLESDRFNEDVSSFNASSISILLEINGRKLLFLADAHPSTVVKSLMNLGYSRASPLDCELIKLSHHASKRNTSQELLSIVKSERFIVTTDGSHHCLPNKTTFARIHNAYPSSKILFNYPELINKIYSLREIKELGECVGSAEGVIEIAN